MVSFGWWIARTDGDWRIASANLQIFLLKKYVFASLIHFVIEAYYKFAYFKLAGATLLIFINKQDLPRALSSAEIDDALSLRSDQLSSRHWKNLSCSAATGDGLADGIDWLVNDVESRIFVME
ncbi:hypothetical protein PsorP6_015304 [Peronosclerospora sorghi]|uniref:Uncharacterized protein n=1 Tax=Peronosclerospora sorghi TaxID=230839 RepID=A0ACC0VSZ5_9STRA|nr:hypothetical protein PsorP6_015304 [Peronosclerospora sorghi]